MKTEIKIIPTVFAKEKKEFDKRFNILIEISDYIQIDFMDGHFVRSSGIKLSDVPNLRNFKNKFEAHLMVKDPLHWIKRLKNKGFSKVIFHYEVIKEKKAIENIINEIHKEDMDAFIAINPETFEDKIFDYLALVEGVLIMGVHPGKEKQTLAYKTHYKLKNIREKSKKIILQVDGGVNIYTAPALAKSGADILNSGSFIGKNKNPQEAYEMLVESVKN